MQWIASCLHSSRPARPELLHQIDPCQFSWCNVLHRVTSSKYPSILMLLPQMVFSRRLHTFSGGWYICEGFIRHRNSPPPDPTFESASPSPPQTSIWHRNRVTSRNWCRIDFQIDAKSTPEEGTARRTRGWGPVGLCLINPSVPSLSYMWERQSASPCHVGILARVPSRSWGLSLGKSKRGLTNGGLSPKFSEKIGGKSFLEIFPFRGKLAPFQGRSGPFRGRSGPIPLHPTATGEAQKLPRKGPFWPDWPLSG